MPSPKTLYLAVIVAALFVSFGLVSYRQPIAVSMPCPSVPAPQIVYIYVGANETARVQQQQQHTDTAQEALPESPMPWTRTCVAEKVDPLLWPAPDKISGSPAEGVAVDPEGLEFTLEDARRAYPILSRAFERYGAAIRTSARLLAGYSSAPRPPPATTAKRIGRVVVKVRDDEDVFLQHGADESYKVAVDGASGEVRVESNTVWGALRGLETAYQLLVTACDGSGQCCAPDGVRIEDAPRYQWRGLLVDTARHWLPVHTLEHLIDGMAYSKLNVLHWHVIDSSSFPLVLESAPELAAKGAYGPRQIYTVQEVQGLVDYANDRGVRIMIEMDVPAHTGSWRPAYPDLVFDCKNLQKWKVDRMAMDATKEEVYALLEKVLNEIRRRFPGRHLHLGGDEVFYDCWKAAPTVRTWMEKAGASEVRALTGYFNERVSAILNPLNTTVVLWEEASEATKLPHRSVVMQVWLGANGAVHKIMEKGWPIIDSHAWHLYIGPTVSWEDMYKYDPDTHFSDPRWKRGLIGAEVCMWGERVDQDNVEQAIWPSAAAAAERFWSPNHAVQRHPDPDRPRITAQMCRMKHRGLHPSTVWSGTCYPPQYILKK